MIIYLTKDKKQYQIIRPSNQFDGNWQGLADYLTGSYWSGNIYHKNYSHYVVL